MPTPTGYTSAYTSTEIDERLGAVPNKADKIQEVNHGTSSTTLAIAPNTFHVWGTVTSLNLTLAAPADSNVVNEYMFRFTSGSTPTTLTLPSSIVWINEAPEIEADTTYECSIINNLGVIGGASNV